MNSRRVISTPCALRVIWMSMFFAGSDSLSVLPVRMSFFVRGSYL